MLIPEILDGLKKIKFHMVITASKSEKTNYAAFMDKVKILM